MEAELSGPLSAVNSTGANMDALGKSVPQAQKRGLQDSWTTPVKFKSPRLPETRIYLSLLKLFQIKSYFSMKRSSKYPRFLREETLSNMREVKNVKEVEVTLIPARDYLVIYLFLDNLIISNSLTKSFAVSSTNN